MSRLSKCLVSYKQVSYKEYTINEAEKPALKKERFGPSFRWKRIRNPIGCIRRLKPSLKGLTNIKNH